MVRLRRTLLGVAGLLLGGLLGCGGSSSASGFGTMTVHLVDGPMAGYQEINVHIQTVEISGSGGWITLATPDKTVNLLDLVGGVEETLAKGATLPAGHYGQLRLVLGAGNTVKLSDGTVNELKVPSGLQTGIKLVVNFDVAPGTTKDVWIDFDAAHSIQVVQAGNSGQYLLRPTIWAYDKLVTGSISGTLTDAATAAALPGAQVYAETLDTAGIPRIARGTVTDASGHFTLDLLPIGSSYHVVSQPLTGTTAPKAYDAKASDAFALSAAAPVFTYTGAFTPRADTGAVMGSLTPALSPTTTDQSDQVNLLQALATPASGAHTFIVRTTGTVVGASAETYGFTPVPAGTYGAQAVRTTLNSDGSTATTRSAVQPAAVLAGATATVNLTVL